MNLISLLKTLFQIFVTGIFLYQMQNSIRKYFEGPIVQMISTLQLDEIKTPEIYICQWKQFNYALGKEYGYGNILDFTVGKVTNSDNASWSGKNGDKTFDELKQILFTKDNADIEVFTSNIKTGLWKAEDHDIVYIAPHGYCTKLRKVSSGVGTTTTTKESSLFLVDPFWSNPLQLMGHKNKIIEFGKRSNTSFDSLTFDVRMSLHDSRLKDGQTCTDYENLGTSYGQCTENILNQFMLKWLGCVLPWTTKSSHAVCNMLHRNESLSQALADIGQFILGAETRDLQPCKPPCQTLQFRTKRVDHYEQENTSMLSFNLLDEVIVETDTYAYDMFSLVVDLGSALGLWLGLSAVSIFASITDFISATHRTYNH